jgi:iron complex transport system ATP-binding protein
VGLMARHVSYERRVVGVDVHVDAGELVMVIGPNGAGKSTLCALLAGDLAPTGGVVELDGTPLTHLRHAALARRRAVLPQRAGAAGASTARELVRMGRHAWEGNDHTLVDAALEEVDATRFADRPYRTLSGGEQARVQLARVLAQDTPILLLDEPTASLDLAHQHLVLGVARRRADAGCAVLAVVHDLALAGAYGDRVVALRDGQVHATGTPVEVLTDRGLTALLGHPVVVRPHPTEGWPLASAGRCTREPLVLGTPNYL